ncbi:solute carrier family 22 member 6 isoform X1 [Hemibagrus wyckioides]|uniref:solute carrier family 22 member 6 isoform X1 n=1 Tax=Hemibagrus wyckioides TaxID=337641 RepID=UPI00266BB1B9|nr:solute carrier family 22 member 6 isoform X1 [Hemibagrus wyckioides]XP_058271439.1 solute carrier family 22 member 6 isoform X1 [Hemibagrus wyckioides]
MAFADLLEQVGSMGRFQLIHVTLLSIPILMMASHNLLQNFVAAVPPHHCTVHTNLSDSTISPAEMLLLSVPLDEQGKLERCRRYVHPQWNLLSKNSSEDLKKEEIEMEGCVDGWSYNNTDMSATIITEWDLVCDLKSLKQMGQTIYMGGVLLGALVFGGLSDKFGRRILLLISNLLLAVAGTCTAFASSFSLFCLFRFFCGMAMSGIILNSFSLNVEWIPTRIRTVVGTATGYCYTTGQLILAGVAYNIQDWRWLTLAVSLPFYVFFLYSWWFLESARWLVLSKKPEEAVKNLKSVARINGRQSEGDKINLEMLQESMKKELSSSMVNHSALDLVRTRSMRTITVCLSAVWFSTSFSYYGLSMDLQKFGVNIYLIQVIFGAVDIPAKIIVTVAMSIVGRRLSLCISLVLAGITILANLLVPFEMQTLRTSLAVIGKGCLAAAFNCCYLYSGELYPTVVRQNGMGWVSTMARLGAMVAPVVLLCSETVIWLPGFIYGGAPVLSGIFAYFLPETLNIPLPDTIQDTEERGLKKKNSKTSKNKEEVAMNDHCDMPLKESA